VNGANLENAKDSYVRVGNRELEPDGLTAKHLILKPFKLTKGIYEITFGVNGSSGAEKGAQASIENLRFTQTK